jgi:hypothetical protein
MSQKGREKQGARRSKEEPGGARRSQPRRAHGHSFLLRLATAKTHSSHCSGIGSDKLAIYCFLKPALAAYDVHCQLESVFSIELWF